MSAVASLALTWETPPSWAPAVSAHPVDLLSDHAHCELKAAASAMTLLKRSPDKRGMALRLAPLVREETEHLHRVLRELDARGSGLGDDLPSPYASGLLSFARRTCAHDGAFLDSLLVSALIEARSHERMALLAGCEELAELSTLYRSLCEAEARHGALFAELALEHHDESAVRTRWEALAGFEGELLAGLPFAPRMHSGPPR